MNIPNILTILRVLMVPVFGYFACTGEYIPAAVTFVAAWLTDILDGQIARRFNMVTSFGKLMDPFADKLIQVTALVILTIQGVILPFIVVIVVIKEILMAIGGFILLKDEKYVVQSSWFGKISAGSFYAAIVLCIFKIPYCDILIIAALVIMFIAFILYIRKYINLRKQLSSNR